jgi:hypothetical protein
MKHVLSVILAGSCLFGSVGEAAAQVAASTPSATSAPREGLDALAPSPPAVRTERNSLPLLFTGVGLAVVGLGGLGGGYAGNVLGRRDCDSSALSATGSLPAAQGAAVYEVAYSRCVNESAAVIGGTAAMIAGGAFAAFGAVFIVAGAWKVTVPRATGSRLVPDVDVGTSSLRLRWTF